MQKLFRQNSSDMRKSKENDVVKSALSVDYEHPSIEVYEIEMEGIILDGASGSNEGLGGENGAW